MIKRKDAKALYCWCCKRPLPAHMFALRKRRNDRGILYTTRRYYCKQCRSIINTRVPLSKEEKQRRYWERQKAKQTKLNGKRAKPRKKPRFLKKHAFIQECTKCSDLFIRRRDTSWCSKCEAKAQKEYREHRKLEDPEWYAGEIARIKEYRESHHRRKKRKHRPGDYFPPKYWEAVLEAFNHQCAYCDGVGDLEQDHVVPYSKGGAWKLSNIVPACPECNGWYGKRDFDMREWLNDEMRYEAILTTMGDIEYSLSPKIIPLSTFVEMV